MRGLLRDCPAPDLVFADIPIWNSDTQCQDVGSLPFLPIPEMIKHLIEHDPDFKTKLEVPPGYAGIAGHLAHCGGCQRSGGRMGLWASTPTGCRI